MKITQLSLGSFRSFVDTGLALNAPRVFIAGRNGAGKSTIREAIKWALTGRCEGLDGKGSGADKLVPTFNQQAHLVDVKVTLQDVIGVHRVWEPRGGSLEVDGFMGTSGEQQKALCDEILKADPSYIDAVLDSTVFLNLHHADAKELVLKLLDVHVTVDEKEYTLAQLDQAYDKAFKDRKSAKDKVKGAFVPAVPTTPEPTLAKKTLADKDAHLNGVKSLLASLRAEVGKYQQKIGGIIAQRADLTARLARVQATSSVNLATVPLDGLDDKILDLEERLSMMEESVAEPAPARTIVGGSIDLDAQRRAAKTMREFDPKNGCVLDGKVKCPVSKVTFFGRARDIEDALDKLAPAAPVNEPVKAAPSPMVAEVAELKRQRQLHADHARTIRHRDLLEQELTAELAALPDVGDDERELSKLQDRVTKGEAILQTASAFYAQLDAYKAAQEHRTALEAEVTRLEGLVDVLGPNGARVQALAAALEPFQRTVNETLSGFGWTVAFQVDPWQVVVNGRPVDTYSRSEQHRIGIALQVAIAEMSGLGFAIIDELDMLDLENRELMGRVVYQSGLDQAIILSTREDAAALPDATKIPGMICVRLVKDQSGRSTVHEQIGEGVAA
jgi:hypothetical protein